MDAGFARTILNPLEQMPPMRSSSVQEAGDKEGGVALHLQPSDRDV